MGETNPLRLSVSFAAPDTWSGGYYELAIELGPRSDHRLIAAHRAIWQHPHLEGCFRKFDVEPHLQQRLIPEGDEFLATFLGVAHMADGKSLPAGTAIVRECPDSLDERIQCNIDERMGSDWLCFFLPGGALGDAYPVCWPIGSHASEWGWRDGVNRFLTALGAQVFEQVPFALALIGFEVSGRPCANELRQTGIPDERWIDYLWPEQGRLRHYPANRPAG